MKQKTTKSQRQQLKNQWKREEGARNARNLKLAVLGASLVFCADHYQTAINNGVESLVSRYGYQLPDPLDSLPGLEAAAIACAEIDIDPNLCRAVATIETGGKHSRISVAGAIGLMQVMPATAKALCPYDNLLLQSNNARCGAAVLAYELNRHPTTAKALQAYNGGPRCVGRCKESINYSTVVLREYKKLS